MERLKLFLLAGILLTLLHVDEVAVRMLYALQNPVARSQGTADDDDGFSPCIDMVKR